MKKFLFLLFASLSVFAAPDFGPVVNAALTPERGWMSNGWNWAKYTFQNPSSDSYKVTKFVAHWRGDNDTWEENLDIALEPSSEASWGPAMYYPDSVRKLSPQGPAVEGVFTLSKANGETISLPSLLEVKTATLETPLQALTGNYMIVSLQKKNWKGEKWEKEMLGWMDEAYAAMMELTGHRPFKGALSKIEETPNAYAWAYAGNPIVLTMDFVPQTLEEFKQGIMSFGWTHEMGHNFDDEIGEYYIWSGPCAEFHANFKLTYAFSHMPSADYLGIYGKGTDYLPLSNEKRMPIKKFSDSFFLCFGDSYLADSERTYDTLNSDEIQAFFQKIVKVYGWDVMKKWYRLFVELNEKDVPKIEKEEDRLPVALAALNVATGQNLIKYYQLWRFPVTEEQLTEIAKKYGWQ